MCAAHVAVWPKLDLGNRQTDFVFRDATGNYLLVELEKSTVSLFRKDGHTANGLNVARGQVQDWLRYIEDNLHTTQNELGLTGISVNPNCLIVIGRSRGLTKQDRRKLRTIENESPNLRIMTYDDVHDDAKAVIENLLGPIWETSGGTRIFYPSA